MAILKIKDEKGNIISIPSIRGEKGQDGLTPFINDNGNWQIGDIDTGVSASGESGETITIDQTYDFDETYIITEEEAAASSWVRNVDLQGNPIRLTEMQVDFTIPAGENTGVQYLYFYYENNENSDIVTSFRATEFAYQKTNKERRISAICYKVRNTFYAIQGYGWDIDDNYTALQFTMGARMGIGKFLNNPTVLRGLHFNVASGMPVAGTVVRIRGKRA